MKLNNNNFNNVTFSARIPYRQLGNNGRIREFTAMAYSDDIFKKIPRNATRADFEKVFGEEIGFVPYGAYVRFLQWKLQGKSYGVQLETDFAKRAELYERLEKRTEIERSYYKITQHDKKFGVTPDPKATDADVIARVEAQEHFSRVPSLKQFENYLHKLNEAIKRNGDSLSMKRESRMLLKRGKKINEELRTAQAIYKICVEKCVQLGENADEARIIGTIQECDDLISNFMKNKKERLSISSMREIAGEVETESTSESNVLAQKSRRVLIENAAAIENIKEKIRKCKQEMDKIDESSEYDWLRNEYQKMLSELNQKLNSLL